MDSDKPKQRPRLRRKSLPVYRHAPVKTKRRISGGAIALIIAVLGIILNGVVHIWTPEIRRFVLRERAIIHRAKGPAIAAKETKSINSAASTTAQ